MKPLGIIELLTRIGEDNVRLQNLLETATNFASRKRGFTAITFLTKEMTPSQVMSGKPDKVGLVVWLPTDLVEKAKAAHDAGVE